VRLENVGDGSILNYAVALAFPNLGKEGNFGAEPYLTSLNIGGQGVNFRQDTPFTIEAQYRYAVGRNISITPGVIVLINRNQNSNNGTDWIATTYNFQARKARQPLT